MNQRSSIDSVHCMLRSAASAVPSMRPKGALAATLFMAMSLPAPTLLAQDDVSPEASECEASAGRTKSFIQAQLDYEVDTVTDIDNVWKAWRKEFRRSETGLPNTCEHDAPLAARKAKAERKLALGLIETAQESKSDITARWILGHLYMENTEDGDDELEARIRTVSASYDKHLLTHFKDTKKYASFPDDVGKEATGGCVFYKSVSRRMQKRKRTPIAPPKRIEAGFTTHLPGAKKVHVFCRLPVAADTYKSGVYKLRLVTERKNKRRFHDEVVLGKPEELGAREFVYGVFDLPGKDYEQSRALFKVMVVLSHDSAGKDEKELGYGTFFWRKSAKKSRKSRKR